MTQPHSGRESDASDERSDATTSSRPGGGRQVEQEPARGRSMGQSARVRPDDLIRAELDALLARSDDFDPAQVQLLVSDGIVVMMGTVSDYEIKRRLDQQCTQVEGVREIHDQLMVLQERGSRTSGGLRGEAPHAGTRGREG